MFSTSAAETNGQGAGGEIMICPCPVPDSYRMSIPSSWLGPVRENWLGAVWTDLDQPRRRRDSMVLPVRWRLRNTCPRKKFVSLRKARVIESRQDMLGKPSRIIGTEIRRVQ